MKTITTKRRTVAVEIENKVACLPGYEQFTLGKEKYMISAKFYRKSSYELKQLKLKMDLKLF